MLIIRKSKGLSKIEIFIAVIVLGVLIAVALPKFIGAQLKAKIAAVKSNMHACQIAAESYAKDMTGVYPGANTDLAPYYPGGGNSPAGSAGNFPVNPFTGAPSSPDAAGSSNVHADREKLAGATRGVPGNVGYTVIGTKSYGIMGYDDKGDSIADETGKQLVLSNQ